MKITIKREDKSQNLSSYEQNFTVDEKNKTLLQALQNIKETEDASLNYRSGCQSGVCGSCAVVVNGVEKLACKCRLEDNLLIEPLKATEVIKDLVVNIDYEAKVIEKSKAYILEYETTTITKEDEAVIDRQSNCILCQSCYSSCPVFEVNKNFVGPYALTRALRYSSDKKQKDNSSILESIQKDGIWDCTLCGNCTMVCPQFIDPKTDIMNLRMQSVQKGYSDPNIQDFSSLNNEFNGGFDPSGGFDTGFNPNGF